MANTAMMNTYMDSEGKSDLKGKKDEKEPPKKVIGRTKKKTKGKIVG